VPAHRIGPPLQFRRSLHPFFSLSSALSMPLAPYQDPPPLRTDQTQAKLFRLLR